MLTIHPFDPEFNIGNQLNLESSNVVLVNTFTLGGLDEETFLELWKDDAEFMKKQPGYISTQLHRALGDSPTYLNYAIWESTEAFAAAFTSQEFVEKLALYPECVVAKPHLFQKVDA